MAPRSFFDVVVVGRTLASLTTGALLARRGFRVVVVGHGTPGATYRYEDTALARELACANFLETPAFQRAMTELALLPTVRRAAVMPEPPWQVVLPRQRLDVYASPERRLAELDREFPEVHRPVEDFYNRLERYNEALDRVFGADTRWPPDGFFERRALRKRALELPFGAQGTSGDLLSEFAADHPFRTFVDAQCRFAGALDPDRMTPLARARLHASAMRGAFLAQGPDGLRRLIEERVQQHGGELRPRDTIERVHVQRGRVTSVSLAGTDEVLGCGALVSGLDAAATQRLTGVAASNRYAARLLAARPRYFRYVLNVVAAAEALPTALARRCFAVRDLTRPLAEENLLAIETTPTERDGEACVTTSALLPRSAVEEGEGYLRRVRGRVLGALYGLMPFLDRYARVIDSPHDGLPLEDLARGVQVTPESRRAGPEAMEPIDDRGPESFLGVCGASPRGDVEGVLLVGREVVPGVGVEGELLAALTAAALVTRADPTKAKMRLEHWNKLEP